MENILCCNLQHFRSLVCVLHGFYMLVTKPENAHSQKVMFLMKSAIHLLEVCLSIYLLCGERE